MRVNHQHETNNLASNSGLFGCALSAQNCAPISPEKNAKLQLEDWSFYVSGHYTGQKRADSATAKTPGGYTIWNTGAAWQVTKDVKLRAGVLNLGDKDLSRDDYSYNEDGRRYFMAVDYRF